MKQTYLFLSFLLFLLVSCGGEGGSQQVVVVTPAGATPTVSPPTATPLAQQPTPAPATIAFAMNNTPVLLRTDIENWNASLLRPGAILYHDNQYHLFFNGSDHWPSAVGIGYATSTDGLNWNLVGDEPVMTAEGIAYTDMTLDVSSALLQNDGTWVIYFDVLNERGSEQVDSVGRATAPAPTGPWTADPEPVLPVGPAGAWDGFAVNNPMVITTPDGYWMYYDGLTGPQLPYSAIGLATSPDGLTWTKYNDPATTDTLYQASDPVYTLNPDREFTGLNLWEPNVQPMADGGWLMAHIQRNSLTAEWGLGYATSPDGRQWTTLTDANVLSNLTHPEWQLIFNATLLYLNDTYHLYFSPRFGSRNESDIYLATSSGPTN